MLRFSKLASYWWVHRDDFETFRDLFRMYLVQESTYKKTGSETGDDLSDTLEDEEEETEETTEEGENE